MHYSCAILHYSALFGLGPELPAGAGTAAGGLDQIQIAEHAEVFLKGTLGWNRL
jgi:hypothetical protein